MRNSQYGVPQIFLITTRRPLESSFTVCGNFPEEAGHRHRRNEVRMRTDGVLGELGERWDDGGELRRRILTRLARDDTTPTLFAAWRKGKKERKRKVIRRHSHNLGKRGSHGDTFIMLYRDEGSHKVKENPILLGTLALRHPCRLEHLQLPH